METLKEQIAFVRNRVISCVDIRRKTMFVSLLASLEKLKAQDDLDEQQAQDHASGKYQSEMDQYNSKSGLFEGMYIIPKTSILNEVLDAQSKEIGEIKETIHAIANKMGIAVITEYPGKNTKTTTIVENGKIEELKVSNPEYLDSNFKTTIDPAVKLLIGDTFVDLTDKLADMYYKTNDLDLLKKAKAYVAGELLFYGKTL